MKIIKKLKKSFSNRSFSRRNLNNSIRTDNYDDSDEIIGEVETTTKQLNKQMKLDGYSSCHTMRLPNSTSKDEEDDGLLSSWGGMDIADIQNFIRKNNNSNEGDNSCNNEEITPTP